jgi:ubiquinol-cytochrome c reductase iron-sulfur subunit
VLALWPFVAALGPTADTVARRVTFNTRDLIENAPAMIAVENRPIAIFRRTETELAWLRDPQMQNKTRDPSSFRGHAFRDRDSDEPRQPAWAKNWHRSLRPEIMVCEAMCTRQDCVVTRTRSFKSNTAFEDSIFCPCCGSHYDLAGRAFSGPAPHNLRVPPYRFLDATTIEFTVSDVLATQA